MRALAAAAVLALCLSPGSSAGKSLGTIGSVYEIAEKDAVQEMRDRAAQVDWDNVQKGTWQRAKDSHFRPFNSTAKLPKAEKGKKYVVDMTYDLEWDVHGLDGEVLYPKGYKINPGDHIYMDHVPVVIDGFDPEQVRWFRKKWGKRLDVALLISDGDPIDMMEKLERRVFWVTDMMIRRFQLKHVPCAIRQVGNLIEIEEFYVSEKEKTGKGKKK